MRKNLYLSFLLVILSVVPLLAEPVGKERAFEVARSFFQYDRSHGLRLVQLRHVEFQPKTKSAYGSAYHVFERQGGGFVIVSGDDRCRPVLAYSFTNSFGNPDSLPESICAWLEDYEEQIELVRSRNEPASRAAVLAWAAVEVSTKAGNGGFEPALKLETPVWGQNAPFNDLAPEIDGKHAVAGCVPLTMSMICRYFSYPERGSGTLPGYTYSTDSAVSRAVEGLELGHSYDWEKIRMEYRDGYTAEEAAAVARLVYDCGVMVQAKYGASNTSANTGNMVRQAIEHLGFDASAVYENRGFYSDDVWTEKLKNELQHNPVLYSARRDGDNGHTFLLDGYDRNDYFSINWGWKGSGNGYYALSSFASSADRAYLYKHAACFGLKPDSGGTGSGGYLFLTSGISSSGSEYKGLEALTDKIVPKKSFDMKVGGISNGGNFPYSGYFILAVTDADGEIKDFVCGSQYYSETNPRSWRGYPSISCLLSIYPREGDRIRLFYCGENEITSSTVPWKPVRWDRTQDTVGEILLSDDQSLAEATSMVYSKTSGILSISTKDGVRWNLSGPEASANEAVSYAATNMTIDTSGLPEGLYTLVLERDAEKIELKLKMGWK